MFLGICYLSKGKMSIQIPRFPDVQALLLCRATQYHFEAASNCFSSNNANPSALLSSIFSQLHALEDFRIHYSYNMFY